MGSKAPRAIKTPQNQRHAPTFCKNAFFFTYFSAKNYETIDLGHPLEGEFRPGCEIQDPPLCLD